jgi:carbamoyl-phosphate synthase large subunit
VSVNIPCITTVQGASAAIQGIEAALGGAMGVQSLQKRHRTMLGA